MPSSLDEFYLFIFARRGSVNVFGVASRTGIIGSVFNRKKGHRYALSAAYAIRLGVIIGPLGQPSPKG